MPTTHKIETAVYASGWVDGRIDDLISGYTKANNLVMLTVLAEMKEMFKTVATTMDELIVENRELNNKVTNARNALQ